MTDNKLQANVLELKDTDYKVSGWCGNRKKCVSVAITEKLVAVRDTKDKSRPSLAFTHDEWNTFVKGVKSGEFDI